MEASIEKTKMGVIWNSNDWLNRSEEPLAAVAHEMSQQQQTLPTQAGPLSDPHILSHN